MNLDKYTTENPVFDYQDYLVNEWPIGVIKEHNLIKCGLYVK